MPDSMGALGGTVADRGLHGSRHTADAGVARLARDVEHDSEGDDDTAQAAQPVTEHQAGVSAWASVGAVTASERLRRIGEFQDLFLRVRSNDKGAFHEFFR